MAVYKVPQDVEADDKLIGPFSFRQFIYLIVVAISGGIAWGLFMLFPLLVIIPLPVILFFGALALPLKRDQPMEIYLAAIASYWLKPRRRLWASDGIGSLVRITAPVVIENQLIKDLSEDEASKRLSYLADISDTKGWAVRGVTAPDVTSNLSEDIYLEANTAPDVLDDTTEMAQSFDDRLVQATSQRREAMLASLQAANKLTGEGQAAEPEPPSSDEPAAEPEAQTEPHVDYNPYPTSIHQSTIQPLGDRKTAVPPRSKGSDHPNVKERTSTSEIPPSPDIINLANNPDLSIESIAHQAKRIHDREAELSDKEVVISLR